MLATADHEEIDMRSIHRPIACIVLVLVLTSCGGDGGGNGIDSTDPVGSLPGSDDVPDADTIDTPEASNDGSYTVGSSTSGLATDPDWADAADGANGFFLTGNNSALLSGPVFGAGIQSNAMMRKSVNWTMKESDSRIRIRQMHVFASGVVNPTQAFLAAVLQNVSDQGVCGIRFADSKALDAAGEELVDEVTPIFAVSSLTGSISDIDDSTDYRSNCLMPGESGYILDTTSLDAGDIESIEIPEFVQGLPFMFTREGIGSGNGIVPISYTLGENDAIEVLVQNNSTIDLQLSSATLIALDESGLPLARSSTVANKSILAPGATATLEFKFEVILTGTYNFAGQSSTVRVAVNFDPPVQ